MKQKENWRRRIAGLLIMVMILSCVPINQKVQAADYSTAGCVDWVKARASQIGVTLPPTGKNEYGLYGASAYWTNLPAQYQRGSEPKANALAIWKFSSNAAYKNYGHVAFVESVNGDTVTLTEGGLPSSYTYAGNTGVRLINISKNKISSSGGCSGFLGYVYLTSADTEPPVISNVQISDVNSEGYTVTCTVSDNVGVTSVKFPSWNIDIHGGGDAEWLEGSRNGNTFSVRVNIANLKSGAVQGYYATHIYAYDGAGNSSWENTNNGIPIFIDRTPPEISNIFVSDVTDTGYTVYCTVTDNTWINRVQFPTWTAYNEQDDIVADWATNSLCSGTADGDTYMYRVNISDHNYELGEYITHIYAYDSAGNFVKGIAPSQIIETGMGNLGDDENPGNPGDDEDPDNSGDPENPGNPEDPENPDNPGDPENPGNPGDGSNTGDSCNPGNTEDSSKPDNTVNGRPEDTEDSGDPEDAEQPAQTTCTITFDGNGGTNLSRRTITVRRNQMMGSMPSIQRKGYLFKGWYTERTGGVKMSYYTRVTKSQTLYARWETVTKPKKAVITTLKKRGKGKFLVKYRKISGSDGYEICYSTSKKFKSSVKKSNTYSLSKTVKGLKKKKNYYVRIRAYKTDSTGSKVYGSYSKTKKVKV